MFSSVLLSSIFFILLSFLEVYINNSELKLYLVLGSGIILLIVVVVLIVVIVIVTIVDIMIKILVKIL